MSKTPKSEEYEALNQKLMMAIVTLTTTFIFVAIALYFLIGR